MSLVLEDVDASIQAVLRESVLGAMDSRRTPFCCGAISRVRSDPPTDGRRAGFLSLGDLRMSRRENRQRRRYSSGLVPWYLREVGGAPYWLLVLAGAIGVGVLAVVILAGPGQTWWAHLLNRG